MHSAFLLAPGRIEHNKIHRQQLPQPEDMLPAERVPDAPAAIQQVARVRGRNGEVRAAVEAVVMVQLQGVLAAVARGAAAARDAGPADPQRAALAAFLLRGRAEAGGRVAGDGGVYDLVESLGMGVSSG